MFTAAVVTSKTINLFLFSEGSNVVVVQKNWTNAQTNSLANDEFAIDSENSVTKCILLELTPVCSVHNVGSPM